MIKRLKRLVVMGLLFSILAVNSVYASIPAWNGVEENHSESILLKNGENYSDDKFEEHARAVSYTHLDVYKRQIPVI